MIDTELFDIIMVLISTDPVGWKAIKFTSTLNDDWRHKKTFWQHTSGLMIRKYDLDNYGKYYINFDDCASAVEPTRRQNKKLRVALLDLRGHKILRKLREKGI